jgi:hypothetical protein
MKFLKDLVLKIVKWIWIGFIIIFALLILPFVIFPIVNNIALNSFSKQLYLIELPNTKVLEKHSICGKLNGNGNGMDFLACVLVKTELAYEELKAELEHKDFKHAKDGAALQYGASKDGEYPVSVDIVKVDSGKLNTDYLMHGEIRFGTLKGLDDYSKYYALVIYDGGYSAFFDIRGH